jgi:predicted nucleotidyltransferase
VTALPPEISNALDVLASGLRADAGDNLLGVILYGGLARGRYVEGSSDINIVIYLRDASAACLAAIAPRLNEAWRTHRVDPFIITPQEMARLTVVFPTKMLDIQRRHVVLMGEDPFDGLTVDHQHIRLRVEQELRNLLLRLRHRFVRVRDDQLSLAQAASDAAPTLAVNLRALLLLQGIVSDEFQPALAIFELAAKTFDLDADALAATKRVHQGTADASVDAASFARLLATIERAADLAASAGAVSD